MPENMGNFKKQLTRIFRGGYNDFGNEKIQDISEIKEGGTYYEKEINDTCIVRGTDICGAVWMPGCRGSACGSRR